MDLITKIFETKRKLLTLHFAERLHLPPISEITTLLAIRELNSQDGSFGARVSEIAAMLCVSVPTVSRCLQKLSSKGYIMKITNEKDRRGTCIVLTPEGEQLCRNALEASSGLFHRALSHLDPDELEQFFRTMDKVYDAIDTELSAEEGQ